MIGVEFNLELDVLYEVKPIQRMIWTNIAYLHPCKIRVAGCEGWSKKLSSSVVRKKFGAGNCDVDFLLSLPEQIDGEQRLYRFPVNDVQTVGADRFFGDHFVKFIARGREIEMIAVRKVGVR